MNKINIAIVLFCLICLLTTLYAEITYSIGTDNTYTEGTPTSLRYTIDDLNITSITFAFRAKTLAAGRTITYYSTGLSSMDGISQTSSHIVPGLLTGDKLDIMEWGQRLLLSSSITCSLLSNPSIYVASLIHVDSTDPYIRDNISNNGDYTALDFSFKMTLLSNKDDDDNGITLKQGDIISCPLQSIVGSYVSQYNINTDIPNDQGITVNVAPQTRLSLIAGSLTPSNAYSIMKLPLTINKAEPYTLIPIHMGVTHGYSAMIESLPIRSYTAQLVPIPSHVLNISPKKQWWVCKDGDTSLPSVRFISKQDMLFLSIGENGIVPAVSSSSVTPKRSLLSRLFSVFSTDIVTNDDDNDSDTDADSQINNIINDKYTNNLNGSVGSGLEAVTPSGPQCVVEISQFYAWELRSLMVFWEHVENTSKDLPPTTHKLKLTSPQAIVSAGYGSVQQSSIRGSSLYASTYDDFILGKDANAQNNQLLSCTTIKENIQGLDSYNITCKGSPARPDWIVAVSPVLSVYHETINIYYTQTQIDDSIKDVSGGDGAKWDKSKHAIIIPKPTGWNGSQQQDLEFTFRWVPPSKLQQYAFVIDLDVSIETPVGQKSVITRTMLYKSIEVDPIYKVSSLYTIDPYQRIQILNVTISLDTHWFSPHHSPRITILPYNIYDNNSNTSSSSSSSSLSSIALSPTISLGWEYIIPHTMGCTFHGKHIKPTHKWWNNIPIYTDNVDDLFNGQSDSIKSIEIICTAELTTVDYTLYRTFTPYIAINGEVIVSTLDQLTADVVILGVDQDIDGNNDDNGDGDNNDNNGNGDNNHNNGNGDKNADDEFKVTQNNDDNDDDTPTPTPILPLAQLDGIMVASIDMIDNYDDAVTALLSLCQGFDTINRDYIVLSYIDIQDVSHISTTGGITVNSYHDGQYTVKALFGKGSLQAISHDNITSCPYLRHFTTDTPMTITDYHDSSIMDVPSYHQPRAMPGDKCIVTSQCFNPGTNLCISGICTYQMNPFRQFGDYIEYAPSIELYDDEWVNSAIYYNIYTIFGSFILSIICTIIVIV